MSKYLVKQNNSQDLNFLYYWKGRVIDRNLSVPTPPTLPSLVDLDGTSEDVLYL